MSCCKRIVSLIQTIQIESIQIESIQIESIQIESIQLEWCRTSNQRVSSCIGQHTHERGTRYKHSV